ISEEKVNAILDLNEKGFTYKEISSRLEVAGGTVSNYLKAFNRTNPFKYNINEDYFKNIDSKAKAYFLGLIYADGNLRLSKNGKSYIFSLILQTCDKEILDKLLKETETDRPLGYNNPSTF